MTSIEVALMTGSRRMDAPEVVIAEDKSPVISHAAAGYTTSE